MFKVLGKHAVLRVVRETGEASPITWTGNFVTFPAANRAGRTVAVCRLS